MENNKLTAVEWLQQLYDNRPAYEEFILPEEFEQAKAMEKQQIETAYNAGREYGCKHDDPETGEQYYTENFENESE